MGKYSLELIVALNDLNMKKDVWDSLTVILSQKIQTEKSVYDSLERRCPSVKVVHLNLQRNEYDNRPAAERNRKVIDDYMSTATADDTIIDYVILSLLQSEIAPAFSSLSNVINHLLLYDLIPLMFFKTYLRDAIHQKSYFSKYAELLRADKFLAISQTVANDFTTMLGFDKSRVISIDGRCRA